MNNNDISPDDFVADLKLNKVFVTKVFGYNCQELNLLEVLDLVDKMKDYYSDASDQLELTRAA